MATSSKELKIRYTADTSGAARGVSQLEQLHGKLGAKLKTIGTSVARTGRNMTVGVTLPLVAAGTAAYKLGAQFDSSMAQVQAASGASAAEMQRLGEIAKETGYSTTFAAQEAADAMLELAKGGISAAQQEAGALQATLDLAAAGELQLADAANTTVQALGAFNLKAEDSAMIADALAGGANASSASVDGLRQALAQVSAVAATAGYDLNTTAGALAMFADRGLQGSDAGTSLKTMLLRLVPATDQAAAAMKRYGLDFTDAEGRMLPLTDVAAQLQAAFGEMGEAQRMAALQTIFGTDAMRAAAIMTQGGADELRGYIAATKDREAAERMAQAQTESDAGTLKKMQATLKTAAIDVQQALAPAVTEVAKVVSDLARSFSELSPETQRNIVKMLALAAAIGPVLIVAGKLASATGSIIGLFKRAGAETGLLARGLGSLKTAYKGAGGGIAGVGAAASSSAGAAIAWAGALTLVAAAGEKVHGYLKQDEDMSKSWIRNIEHGGDSLADLGRRIEAVGDRENALADTLDGDLKLYQAYDLTVAKLTEKWRGWARAVHANDEQQQKIVEILGEAVQVTNKERRAVILAITNTERWTGELSDLEEQQIKNLLKMGDVQAALKLLNDKLKDGTRWMRNYVNWNQTLEGQLADTSRAAYAAYRNQQLYNDAVQNGTGGGGNGGNGGGGNGGGNGGNGGHRDSDRVSVDRTRFGRGMEHELLTNGV